MLFNAKRRNTNRQLTPMNKTPNLAELQGLIAAAGDRPGLTCEMPIILGDESSRVYHLAILCRRKQSESALSWWLYQGKEFEDRLALWHYDTHDIAIIHNMLLCSLDDQTSAGPERLDTYAATPAPAPKATIQAASTQVVNPPTPSSRDSFYGNLSKLPIEGVLQTLASSDLTGALKIHHNGAEATIFLKNGKVVHCLIDDISGDTAFLEVSLWREGSFEFIHGLESPMVSIQRPLQGLLLEYAAYADYRDYLCQNLIEYDSFLLSAHVSHDQYMSALAESVPVDSAKQLQVFETALNGTARLSDIICNLSLKRSQWAPIVFNLCKARLLKAIERPPAIMKAQTGQFPELMLPDLTSLRKALVRQDTGLLSYNAFVYFLEQERLRYETFHRSFSIIILRVIEQQNQSLELLGPDQMLEIGNRLTAVKRKSDLLCHFETIDLALLLPDMTEESCRFFLTRIRDTLRSKPLNFKAQQADTLVVALGHATISPGYESSEALIGMALQRRDESLDRQLVG